MGVRVADPLGAARDPALAFLARALDPAEAGRRIAPLLAGREPGAWLAAIHVVRHKPGRRCLVEYRFEADSAAAGPRALCLLGKTRARGADRHTHALGEALWRAGLRPGGPLGVAVPEPIGVVPPFHMVLQRRVPGCSVGDRLDGPRGAALMARVAEAAHALHTAGIPPRRRHGTAEELRILAERLCDLGRQRPEWRSRLERLLDGSRRLAAGLGDFRPRGIHRDFHPDQLIVEGDRLTLLDLDLYALGDPALDIGNFAGHLVELALRTRGDPDAFRDQEEALAERYLACAGDGSRERIRSYATLTLARHVHISTTFPSRRHATADLLELCERRLGAGRPARLRSSAAAAPRRETTDPPRRA